MKKIFRILFVYVPLGYVALSLFLVLLFKWVPVKVSPLMLKRWAEGTASFSTVFDHEWIPVEEISPNLLRCVIGSEDGRFFSHKGFDLVELEKMHEKHVKQNKPLRGCSTISQQTAKNCFTWCSRTWLRKGIEAYYTVLIEALWGKKRIIEVYLNIVEMGPGIYGVESACRNYFKCHASKVSEYNAASLTCCLPNPLKRTPAWAKAYRPSRCSDIVRLSHDVILPF